MFWVCCYENGLYEYCEVFVSCVKLNKQNLKDNPVLADQPHLGYLENMTILSFTLGNFTLTCLHQTWRTVKTDLLKYNANCFLLLHHHLPLQINSLAAQGKYGGGGDNSGATGLSHYLSSHAY